MNNKRILLLVFVFFLIYFSPYFFKGKNSYIQVHDNLEQLNQAGIFDGKFQGGILPSKKIPDATLPGVSPIFRVGQLSLSKIFFSFSYFWGYVLNEIIIRIIGFLGLFYLLKIFKNKSAFPDYLLALISLAFISLPFWSPGYLSIAGLPLLILAFYNFYKKRKLFVSYLSIILYAFYSNLFVAGIFVGIILIVIYVYLLIKRKLNKHLIFGAMVLFLGFVVSHYSFFLIVFYYRIPTNRVMQSFQGYGFWETLKRIFAHFFTSHIASQSFHARFILESSLPITFFLIIKRKYKHLKLILILWSYLILSSVIFGIYYYQPILEIINHLKIGFRIERFYFLNPAIWFILWGILLIELFNIMNNKKTAKIIIAVLAILQIGYGMKNSTFVAFTAKPTFEDFIAEKQFAEIEPKLSGNKTDYRVGCIGFFPCIANYNGFKTVGSFSVFYPLEFKQKFYRIIKDELAGNKEIEDFFLKWGIHVFLFDDKIGKKYYEQDYIKQHIPEIVCKLNIEELQKFNVKYLFSVAKISNFEELGLKEIACSNNPKYFYRFFVYELPAINNPKKITSSSKDRHQQPL